MEPIRQVEQVEQEYIPEPAFERRQRPRHAEPNQTESTICDVMWCMDVVGGASLYYGFVCWGDTTYGMDYPPFP